MCGIAGFVNRSTAPVSPTTLRAMANVLRHRGPNDEGFLVLNSETGAHLVLGEGGAPVGEKFNVALAHRRLSIVDLSPRGHQPMARGGLWIVFNGEIYNYLELRTELRALGHTFSTDTDTEVILAAYQEWGTECLNRF